MALTSVTLPKKNAKFSNRYVTPPNALLKMNRPVVFTLSALVLWMMARRLTEGISRDNAARKVPTRVHTKLEMNG